MQIFPDVVAMTLSSGELRAYVLGAIQNDTTDGPMRRVRLTKSIVEHLRGARVSTANGFMPVHMGMIVAIIKEFWPEESR